MKKLISWSMITALALAGTLTLSACGGGGGGSSVPAAYTGATTQATVTDTNAETLALTGFEGGSDTASLMVLSAGAEQQYQPQLDLAASSLERIARSLPIVPAVTPQATETLTEYSLCGATGSYTITLTTNDAQTSVNGSIVFSNYDDCENVIDGTITFSGSANSSGDVSITMTFATVSFSDPLGSSFTLSGTFSASFNANTQGGRITMSVVFADQASDETYYFTYTLTATAGVNYEDMTVTGRFYDFWEGYLQISTVVPIRTYDGANGPTSGKLRFDGAGGTWLTYEITGLNTYTIEYFDGTNTGTITGTN